MRGGYRNDRAYYRMFPYAAKINTSSVNGAEASAMSDQHCMSIKADHASAISFTPGLTPCTIALLVG